MTDKVMTMAEAVKEFVHDDELICVGGFTHGIPYAFAHEIIRQRRRVNVFKETPDVVVDQLLAAGCVKKLMFSWAANPGAGFLHAFRRAVEEHVPYPIEIEEYTHLISAARIMAGASGMPFIPINGSVFLTDLSKHISILKAINCPFTGKKVCLVKAVNPDVGLIHAQRADRKGNTQMWGIIGSNREIAMASRDVIVSVEEIVDSETIRRDPNRTIIPSFRVRAVVKEPWGAHPSYVQGYYDRDNQFHTDYDIASRTLEGQEKFLEKWVFSVSGRGEYTRLLGAERMLRLKPKPYTSLPVDYGYYG